MPLFDHTAGQWQRDKTHCPRGHPYDAENTVRNAKGGRMCRTCRKEQSRRAWERYKRKLTPRYPVEVSAAHLATRTPEIHAIRVSLEQGGIPGVAALGEVSAALWAVRRAMRNEGVAKEDAYVSVYDNCIVFAWPARMGRQIGRLPATPTASPSEGSVAEQETGVCSDCRVARNKKNKKRAASYARANNKTRLDASRNGYDWTGPELELIARRELTARELAMRLGRTLGAVKRKRQALSREETAVTALAPPI